MKPVVPSLAEPSDKELLNERQHFLALADAFIAEAERDGIDLDDALSELRVRANIRRKKAEADGLQRLVNAEIEEDAKKAEEERRREKEAKKGKRT